MNQRVKENNHMRHLVLAAASALTVLLIGCSSLNQSNPTNPSVAARVEVPGDGTVGQPSIQQNRTTQTTSTVIPEAPPIVKEASPVTPTLTVAVPTKAATSLCTNVDAFVTDVTVPDDALIAPGQTFTKTWRIRNAGTCAWGAGYSLAFESGDRMGASSPIAVPSTPPGATADLSVTMTAPMVVGAKQNFWQLRVPSGTAFSPHIWVQVNVKSGMPALAPIAVTGGPGLDDPARAATFESAISSLPVGTAEWIRFDYDTGGNTVPRPTVEIQLLNGVTNGLGFEVYSPETIVDGWSNNNPVGRGTPEMIGNCNLGDETRGSCTTNNLDWIGGFGVNGAYFVRIINKSGNTVAPQVIIGGKGLAQCANIDQNKSLATDQSVPLFRIQCQSPVTGKYVP
jgi:hypothetical protein